jgi:hypothetical protein
MLIYICACLFLICEVAAAYVHFEESITTKFVAEIATHKMTDPLLDFARSEQCAQYV